MDTVAIFLSSFFQWISNTKYYIVYKIVYFIFILVYSNKLRTQY